MPKPAATEPPAQHRRARGDILPRSLPPGGISREESAAYVGISAGKFDEMVADGRMPKAKRIDGRKVWIVRRLDLALDALPDDGDESNIWDRLCGLPSKTAPAP